MEIRSYYVSPCVFRSGWGLGSFRPSGSARLMAVAQEPSRRHFPLSSISSLLCECGQLLAQQVEAHLPGERLTKRSFPGDCSKLHSVILCPLFFSVSIGSLLISRHLHSKIDEMRPLALRMLELQWGGGLRYLLLVLVKILAFYIS